MMPMPWVFIFFVLFFCFFSVYFMFSFLYMPFKVVNSVSMKVNKFNLIW